MEGASTSTKRKRQVLTVHRDLDANPGTKARGPKTKILRRSEACVEEGGAKGQLTVLFRFRVPKANGSIE